MQKGKTFYDFFFNTRLVKSTIVHFQVETLFIAAYYVDSRNWRVQGSHLVAMCLFHCYMLALNVYHCNYN